jgi:outer membrane protein assembly factor BamB
MSAHLSVQLVIIGIKGTVVALDRSSGAEVWRNSLKGGSQFVNVSIDRDQIFATTSGELFCLDKTSGQTLWHNRLRGLGQGLVTVATEGASSQVAVLAEKLFQDQQQAAAVAASTSSVH